MYLCFLYLYIGYKNIENFIDLILIKTIYFINFMSYIILKATDLELLIIFKLYKKWVE